MQFNFIRDDGTSIHIPSKLIFFATLELLAMLVILYFNYVSPSVYAAGYEAKIAALILFALFLHASATVAVASMPGIALWPAKYVK